MERTRGWDNIILAGRTTQRHDVLWAERLSNDVKAPMVQRGQPTPRLRKWEGVRDKHVRPNDSGVPRWCTWIDALTVTFYTTSSGIRPL